MQSALSVSVGRLEKELGIELFDCSKRQIALTAPGELSCSMPVTSTHSSSGPASVEDYREQLTGTVTLGTLMSWGTLNLLAALQEFRRLNPMVTVRLRQSLTGSAGHLDAIADGKMDLALVSISSSPSRLVSFRQLTEEPMVFVCEPTHALAQRDHVQLADLDGQDFIHFPQGWGIRRRLDAGFADAGVHPINAYEVADYAIAAELIRYRLATTVLPISAANRFPDLHTVPLKPALTWTLSLVSAAPQPASRAARPSSTP